MARLHLDDVLRPWHCARVGFKAHVMQPDAALAHAQAHRLTRLAAFVLDELKRRFVPAPPVALGATVWPVRSALAGAIPTVPGGSLSSAWAAGSPIGPGGGQGPGRDCGLGLNPDMVRPLLQAAVEDIPSGPRALLHEET
jgi:hypothetical protein